MASDKDIYNVTKPSPVTTNAMASDKESSTVTKPSPLPTNATASDKDISTVTKPSPVSTNATTVRKARKAKGKNQDEGSGVEQRKQKRNVRNV